MKIHKIFINFLNDIYFIIISAVFFIMTLKPSWALCVE